MRLNPMLYQAQLEEVLNAGKGSLVLAGDLGKHKYLTKAKTDEEAVKEQADAKLQSKPATGYMFSLKNARVISGAGIGTIMEQIVTSGIKPAKSGTDTFVECRCGHRMPKLYVQDENGSFVDISKEFENQPVSYQGPIQVCYSLSKGSKDERIYINVDGVLFATKPDIFVPDEQPGRNVSSAFAATGFYGQAAAPAQPADFAQTAVPAQTVQQAAPAAQAPLQQAAPVQTASQQAAPVFSWPS